MRILKFECDGRGCSAETENTDDGKFPRYWITIGSESGGSFLFRNLGKDGIRREINRYSDLHFCSQGCFVGYFFRK